MLVVRRFPLMLITAFAALVPGAGGQSQRDLNTLELEDLMRIEVTSVSKREQKVADSPAAVFVITQEDIRRSGMTSVPELLRMVPGLDVARINASEWAVSSRGFNGRYANKLLVLIDGRSLYSLSNEVVFWEVQHLFLADIERIEIIRGPGATVWGAGAVNGVVNIILKRARATQGGMLTGGVGSQERGFGALRYGGRLNKGFYRVYGMGFDRDSLPDTSGFSGKDDSRFGQGGARVELNVSQRDSLTLQGDFYRGVTHHLRDDLSFTPPYSTLTRITATPFGGNVVVNWKHTVSDGSSWSLRFYHDTYDLTSRAAHTFDLDFQHRFIAGRRHEIVWGGDFRQTRDSFEPSIEEGFRPLERTGNLVGGFIQDDITVVKDLLHVSGGIRVDHAPFAAAVVEPNITMLWTPSKDQTYWAAYSMTARPPDRAHHDLNSTASVIPPTEHNPLPIAVTILGSPDTRSERVRTFELGSRWQIGRRLSLDVSAFRSDYNDVQTNTPGIPRLDITTPPPHLLLPITFTNFVHGHGYGGEVFASYKPVPQWKLMAGYSFARLAFALNRGAPLSTPEMPAERTPTHQMQLRSQLNLTRTVQFDQALYFVGRLKATDVPSYTRVDLRLGWRPWQSIDLSLDGRNLLRPAHLEFIDWTTNRSTQDTRNVALQFTWSF